MSSRRDSAFSDGAINNICMTPNNFRHSTSDCTNKFKTNSYNLEQISKKMHEIDLKTHYSDPQYLPQTSVFSNCEMRSHCNSELTKSQCCQNNAYPADPGGNRILKDITSSNYKPICSSASSSSTEGNKKSEKSKGQRLLQLCSQRLLPKTHRTDNSILHIMEDGEVVVELMKKKGSAKRIVVCDVLRISPDGAKIILYEPNGGKGVPPGATPPPIPPQGGYESYTIENLPENHWKKYMHAYQFVALIKEKTPKVTCYNDKMKCVLMENLTDFEATFYEGGSVTKSSLKGITFQDSSGNKLLVKTTNECRSLTGTFEYMWSQSQEALKHCLALEEMLSKLTGPNFPAIIGRRPVSSAGKENHTQSTSMMVI